MDELWDVKAVARYLKLTERTVYEKARRGALPALRVGGRWRFRQADIEAWLDAQAAARPDRYAAPGAPSGARVEPPSIAAEPGREPTRTDLEVELEGVADQLERRLRFVALLTTACVARGWQPPVIVGGHAVEFYTVGAYATMDIDLVSMSEPLEAILGSWGFRREGRYWIDEALSLLVEAPGSRLEPGQRERLTAVQTDRGIAYVLGPEDLILDRLNACVHWRSQEDCFWARTLFGSHLERLDLEYLRERAEAEGVGPELRKVEEEAST
jgi:excisionase family DNA binding protein